MATDQAAVCHKLEGRMCWYYTLMIYVCMSLI